jgi:Rieske Fe-S protein
LTDQTPGQAAWTRRIVFQGMGALGTAVALAACGSDDGGDEGTDGGSAPGSGTDLAAASEVPVGGGLILSSERIVITQPTEGDFKAFSAVCTHQNCVVAGVDQTINCTCHGSSFSIEDGSVEGGPAPSALEAVAIEVQGDRIVAT